MANSLLTGVSGLLAHQRLLDLVGHNIANVNTIGYKSQRVLFSDLAYETLRGATSSNVPQKGGTNPNQIGLGVKLAATDRKFSQGSLESTGEQFDMALSGDGFFVVNDGSSDFYTRAGMFRLDEEHKLVAPSGMRVKRIPGVGEPAFGLPAFQIPGDDDIRVPLGSIIPGTATGEVELTGNLDARNTPPLAEVMQSPQPFTVSATGQPATLATLLNDVDTVRTPYAGGDQLVISGVNADGTDITPFNMAVDGTTTIQDLINTINGAAVGFTASLDINGNLRLDANNTGPSQFGVNFRDATGNTGQGSFTGHSPVTVIEGKIADTYSETVNVIDSRGEAHEIDLTFEKVADDVWRMTADMSIQDGTVVDGVIDDITFNDDGSLRSTGDSTLSFDFNGIGLTQDVDFLFDANSGLQSLSHRALNSALSRSQDGAEAGTLESVGLQRDGTLVGISSNGRIVNIAQLAIASFRNPKGLVALGDNLYQRTLNSGDPEVGLAGSGARGEVFSTQLESSNVDLAFEFTRLIVAQRGFSANARTITVSDEVLEELTNIIR